MGSWRWDDGVLEGALYLYFVSGTDYGLVMVSLRRTRVSLSVHCFARSSANSQFGNRCPRDGDKRVVRNSRSHYENTQTTVERLEVDAKNFTVLTNQIGCGILRRWGSFDPN
jgi:hypothetical protein